MGLDISYIVGDSNEVGGDKGEPRFSQHTLALFKKKIKNYYLTMIVTINMFFL